MERLEVEILARIDGFEKSLNSAQAKLQKFGEAANDLGASLSKALTLPILGLGAASLKSFGDIQALKNGLTAVTGSADEAAKQFVRLQVLAKLPGLGLQEVAKGAINLQTIGFTAEKAEKSMQAFGNAVATVGKGKAEFERAIYGLQQLANTDFPLGEDLNILKDAIPQITPLLKEAFGTARSDELTKLGITSAQVVDTIVNGLAKLPPVTGGINGAFENLSDGVTTNLAKIGESINEAFDVSGIIDSFIETLNSVTDAFANLSPETKKVIFIIAGVLAAAGPLLLILGTLATTVIPAVTAGITVLGSALAFIVSPIGLIVAAIAGAVALIIYNWDSIVAYFTTGDGAGVFTALKDAFNSGVTFIMDLWEKFVDLLREFWDKWGADIIAAAKFYFGLISTYFKVVFAVIAGIFKAGSAILNGEWAKAGDALFTITKNIWNGILSIITSVVKAGSNLIGKFFEAIGLEKFGKELASVNNFIADFIKNKFSFNIPITADVKDKSGNSLVDTTTPAKKAAANTTKNLGKTEKIKAPDLEFPNTPEGDAKKFREYMGKLGGLDGLKVNVPKLDVILPPPAKIELGALVDIKQAELDAKIFKIQESFEKLSKDILSSGLQDAFAAVGTSLGESLASGGNIVATLGASLLGIVGSVAIQLGKAAIGVGIAMIGIKKAFSNPFTAIAAGVALIALGSFISSKVANITKGPDAGGQGANVPIKAFANGGIISGPTVGLMGEYAGARSNPEVVAPLNKLKGLIGGNNGGENIYIANSVTRGEDIVTAYDRAKKRLNTIR